MSSSRAECRRLGRSVVDADEPVIRGDELRVGLSGLFSLLEAALLADPLDSGVQQQCDSPPPTAMPVEPMTETVV
ncbi:hypothetical protein [Halalkaliarchaeum desulfuricum]|uniref:hypothetical protein n=1 Tax=Halalkaliarchaeum desulfuricum TaxID=2055893 RepID=UPI000E6C6BB6|nr:hypothetical protein [Halalkaliarchaeum desulfuricum]